MSSSVLSWFQRVEDLFAISVKILSYGTYYEQVFDGIQFWIFCWKCVASLILLEFYNYSTLSNMVWCLSKSTYMCVQSKVYTYVTKSLCKATSMCIIKIYKYIEYIENKKIENIFQTHHTNS